MPAFEPVRYAALTDVGVKRSHNQDACSAQPAVDASAYEANGHVFVVADGMGGHAVGEKASAKAVRDIPFLYLKHAKNGIGSALRQAFVETNAGIHAIGEENHEFRGMGTTGTALVLPATSRRPTRVRCVRRTCRPRRRKRARRPSEARSPTRTARPRPS